MTSKIIKNAAKSMLVPALIVMLNGQNAAHNNNLFAEQQLTYKTYSQVNREEMLSGGRQLLFSEFKDIPTDIAIPIEQQYFSDLGKIKDFNIGIETFSTPNSRRRNNHAKISIEKFNKHSLDELLYKEAAFISTIDVETSRNYADFMRVVNDDGTLNWDKLLEVRLNVYPFRGNEQIRGRDLYQLGSENPGMLVKFISDFKGNYDKLDPDQLYNAEYALDPHLARLNSASHSELVLKSQYLSGSAMFYYINEKGTRACNIYVIQNERMRYSSIIDPVNFTLSKKYPTAEDADAFNYVHARFHGHDRLAIGLYNRTPGMEKAMQMNGFTDINRDFEKVSWNAMYAAVRENRDPINAFREVLPTSLKHYDRSRCDGKLDWIVASSFYVQADGETSFGDYFGTAASSVRSQNNTKELITINTPPKGRVLIFSEQDVPHLTPRAKRHSYNALRQMHIYEQDTMIILNALNDQSVYREGGKSFNKGYDIDLVRYYFGNSFDPSKYNHNMANVKINTFRNHCWLIEDAWKKKQGVFNRNVLNTVNYRKNIIDHQINELNQRSNNNKQENTKPAFPGFKPYD